MEAVTILKDIEVDYGREVFKHDADKDEISVTFDERGGARWRSPHRYLYGTFSAVIKCPAGDTSGLNCNIYLSSLEGDRSQDEIDFEFLGKCKSSVQTNFYTRGKGNREQIHELGFDASEDFHCYEIRWTAHRIEWFVDDKLIRAEERKDGDDEYPSMPMFLYASVWDASYIDEGRWTGPYLATHSPYVCFWRQISVPPLPYPAV